MSNKPNGDELLREAFEVLTPYQCGSSDEANRKAELREKIARYLVTQGKPVAGGGGGGPMTFATGGSAGGSGVGGWPTNRFICTSVGFGGGGHDYALRRAKELGKPVLFGGGGGAGQQSFSIWIFPDGHTETMEVGETPRWPKENPVRDAVRANSQEGA
jgi:hypothetical protein